MFLNVIIYCHKKATIFDRGFKIQLLYCLVNIFNKDPS